MRVSCAFGYLGELRGLLLYEGPRSLQGVLRKGEYSPGWITLPVGEAEGMGSLVIDPSPSGCGGAPRSLLLRPALYGASGRSRFVRAVCQMCRGLGDALFSQLSSSVPGLGWRTSAKVCVV